VTRCDPAQFTGTLEGQRNSQLSENVLSPYNGSVTVTRNSSEDEITNVGNVEKLFMTTTSTPFTECAPKATEFGEITHNKGHCAVQGHSRSPILVPIESSYKTSY